MQGSPYASRWLTQIGAIGVFQSRVQGKDSYLEAALKVGDHKVRELGRPEFYQQLGLDRLAIVHVDVNCVRTISLA